MILGWFKGTFFWFWVLGIGKTPPPCWTTFPNNPVFFFSAYLSHVGMETFLYKTWIRLHCQRSVGLTYSVTSALLWLRLDLLCKSSRSSSQDRVYCDMAILRGGGLNHCDNWLSYWILFKVSRTQLGTIITDIKPWHPLKVFYQRSWSNTRADILSWGPGACPILRSSSDCKYSYDCSPRYKFEAHS